MGFKALHAALGAALAERFPGCEAVQLYGIASFQAPLARPPPEAGWIGTLPRTHVTLAPTERKEGITVHLWHPLAPTLIQDNASWLQEAGFKPMVGCLQWNRKAPCPIDVFERLLDAAKAAT